MSAKKVRVSELKKGDRIRLSEYHHEGEVYVITSTKPVGNTVVIRSKPAVRYGDAPRYWKHQLRADEEVVLVEEAAE